MRTTTFEAKMRFVDVSALADAQLSVNGNQTIADLGKIKDDLENTNYATTELNQFVLDGTKDIIPDHVNNIAYISSKTSNKNGLFNDVPTVRIQFGERHTSAGITLRFGEDCPKKVRLTWYLPGGTKITSKDYEPDSIEYFCKMQVENYSLITIEFLESRLPYQYASLQYVIFGGNMVWSGGEIKNATLLEEVNDISSTLSINTLNLSILDEKNDFDIQNERGAWKSVQRNQSVEVNEYVNGEKYPLGTYYLTDRSFSKNIASFSLIDTIGLMDDYTFYGGDLYTGETAGTILEKIFQEANISKYEIAQDVYDIQLKGTLGIQTCREALQMVCFACGAVAEDIRSDVISVHKPKKYVSSAIFTDRKFNTEVELDDYVSGVSIEYSEYNLSSEKQELYKGILPKGQSLIQFSNPVYPHDVTVSAGTIVKNTINYVVVNMPAEGECIITGKYYNENVFTYSVNNEVEVGEVPNVKSFGKCTLYNRYALKENAERILEYFALRKKVKIKYVLNNEKAGDWVTIKSINRDSNSTLIESQSIDLTGGFIAQATCRGYIKETKNKHYVGEIYSGSQWKGL